MPTPKTSESSKKSQSLSEDDDRGKSASLTKRAKLIEEKLKNKKAISLFDTDGDLSRHNIIEGPRRTRNRTNSSESSVPKKKSVDSVKKMPIYKNAKQKLLTKNLIQNEQITAKLNRMEEIQKEHDASVKELYHLELFQNMLDYNPNEFVNDIRYNKYVQEYDLWESLRENKSVTSDIKDSAFIDILQSALYESSHIPRHNDQLVNTIHSGTGQRHHHRQFATLKDYLASFYALDESTEDATREVRDAYIQREIELRQRLNALNQQGGFSTKLKVVANRKPEQPTVKTQYHHDQLLTDVSHLSKVFQANARYKRSAARKCARAVEKYWENIRTQDERAQREEIRRVQRVAKQVSNQVKRKWKLIERVCEARLKEVLKEQKAEEGRRHLELILEHSEHVLGLRKEELRHQSNPHHDTDTDIDEGTDTNEEDQDIFMDNEEENIRDHIIEDDDDVDESEDDEDTLRQLEEDQNLSVEELIQKYRNMHEELPEPKEVDENDEYEITSEEEDTPIEEDGETDDDDAEINALQDEANMSVEELMKKYNYQPPNEDDSYDVGTVRTLKRSPSPTESSDSHDDKRIKLEDKTKSTLSSLIRDDSNSDEDEHDIPASDLRNKELSDTQIGNEDVDMSDTSALISSPKKETQKTHFNSEPDMSKGYTSTPFLLRGTLREYQKVGLDWLASLYHNGINGILADEMGLGKTIQTISLLAYLACEKGEWGPHLVVVPTSVILNWEMEFKKWLPGFKIMTYYGSPKERREKRTGWSKDNAFHVCITSYQLVLQDQSVFRRKQWHYLILDEAHNIKNFRSQRWQVLLNFNAKRRLLLTGTPLQNNLIELWSLLYFLMPNGVSEDMPIGFANLKEFQEWFSNPVERMIENHDVHNEESRNAIQKLHTVLRPYLLRRLKADVEKQMPEKHEHVVYCKLSKRQRFLYDDFMSRAKTKETLASGNFLNIINCLMQLRKVCNHPDLFEERPILTSFAMVDDVQYLGQKLECTIRRKLEWGSDGQYEGPRFKLNLSFLNLIFTDVDHQKVLSHSVADDNVRLQASKEMLKSIAMHQKQIAIAKIRGVNSKDYHDLKKYAKYQEMRMHMRAVEKLQTALYVSSYRCAKRPIYGSDLIRSVSISRPWALLKNPRHYLEQCDRLCEAVQSYKERMEKNQDLIKHFGCVTPKVVMRKDQQAYRPVQLENLSAEVQIQVGSAMSVENDIFHTAASRLSIAFPDKRLLQYDCGKLQQLDQLLRKLASGGHRALIFTQMTRVLDILETFLNMHGHRYLRLDGATKVEQRQVLTEYFNNDKRILCFILSTRSGGLGINLTGADTVIFYDSDWNPAMDKQCQDRAHRIGQTRDVHIYRFVTEFTIEENIFKKANQKRMLDDVVIQEGGFTEDYFHKNEWWKELPEVVGGRVAEEKMVDFEQAILEAEDENDAAAAIEARKEMRLDDDEFEDNQTPKRQMSEPSSIPVSPAVVPLIGVPVKQENPHQANEIQSGQTSEVEGAALEDQDLEDQEEDMNLDVGHVDQYMLQFWEREMVGVDLGFGGFSSK